MKKTFWLTIMSAVVSTALYSQTFTCINSGSWTDGTIWSGGVAPGSGPAVLIIFNSNVTVDVSAATVLSVGGLQVTNNAAVTLTTSANKSMSVSNGSNATDFNVEGGATLLLTTTSGNTISLAASGTGVHKVDGTLEQQTNGLLALASTTVTGIVRTYSNATGVVSGGSTLNWSAGSLLEIAGNGGGLSTASFGVWNASAKLLYSGTTSTSPAISGSTANLGIVEVNCAAASVPINLSTAGALTFNVAKLDVINTGSGSFSFGANTTSNISGNLTIVSGSVYQVGTATKVAGNIANGGTISTAGTSTLTMNGSAPQFLSSAAMSGSVTFEVNNSAGVILTGNVALSHNLLLTAGIITTTASDLLSMEDGKTVTGGAATSHINGPMKKTGDDAFAFPIGDGAIFAPAVIGAGGAPTDAYTATYFSANQGTTTINGGDTEPLLHVSSIEYWDMERNNGSAPRTVGLTWGAHSEVSAPADLRVGHLDGGMWSNVGGTAAMNVVTSDPVASFSPFTLASISVANALPLELLRFNALVQNQTVVLSWETANEKEVQSFVVERSLNGTQWEIAGQVASESAQRSNNAYILMDTDPFPGRSYYRLKMVENSGLFNYSKVITVHNKQQEIRLFPNPAKEFTTLSRQQDTETDVQLYNQQGVLVRQFSISDRQEQISVAGLPSGTYTLSIQQGNQVQSVSLFVQ